MNEAGPWGKGAKEGTGGWGNAGDRRQGRVQEVTGGIRVVQGFERLQGARGEKESS